MLSSMICRIIWLLTISSLIFSKERLSSYAIECGQSSAKQFDTRINVAKPSNKIIGGDPARMGAWPWQAFLLMVQTGTGQVFQCGGTVISEYWIMTAAHCVFDAQKIVAFVGITDITGLQNENGNAIESKYVHPLYMDTATHVSNYDIALIKLSNKLWFNSTVQPICLPADDQYLTTNTGYMTGWGRYTIGNSSSVSSGPSRDLLQTEAPFIDQITCQKARGRPPIGADQLCAGALGHGVYSGDSGGPLQVRASDGRWYQTGIMSYAVANESLIVDQYKYPGVYCRVSFFCDFIDKTTSGSVICSTSSPPSSASNHVYANIGGLTLAVISARFLSKIMIF